MESRHAHVRHGVLNSEVLRSARNRLCIRQLATRIHQRHNCTKGPAVLVRRCLHRRRCGHRAGALAKYVVVNLEEWNTTTSYNRPKDTISLTVPKYAKSVEVKYLSAPGAESTTVTWVGQSWNYSSSAVGEVEVTGSVVSTTLEPKNGKIQVMLNASEAVMVTLER